MGGFLPAGHTCIVFFSLARIIGLGIDLSFLQKCLFLRIVLCRDCDKLRFRFNPWHCNHVNVIAICECVSFGMGMRLRICATEVVLSFVKRGLSSGFCVGKSGKGRGKREGLRTQLARVMLTPCTCLHSTEPANIVKLII